MRLHTRILLGLGLGVVVGFGSNLIGVAQQPVWQGTLLPLLDFAGRAFIRLITMVVIPLVVASLLTGVASLGDVRKLGRMGGKTIAYYLFTTMVAISLGLALALWVKPGSRLSATSRDALAAQYTAEASQQVQVAAERPGLGEVLLEMIPTNPVAAAAQGNLLPLIIFVLIFGAAISLVAPARRDVVLDFFHGLNDASMRVIDWIMQLAPYAVFALLASVTSRFGLDVLRSLAIYAGVVVGGLLLHTLLTYGTLVSLLGRMNPLRFFRQVREPQLIAFSTSSSNATLPLTIETAEEKLGVSNAAASFVLPLGATLNMDGTALYQGVAVVFIAQIYGIELSLAALLTVVLTATLSSVGTAGVPSAGIVTLILVLESVGLAQHAAAGIALILGVDRVLDMLRTAVNVTGDLSAAVFVARTEGELAPPAALGAAA